MGLNTRFETVADETYSAPTTSAAAVAVTFTTNTPTATTAQTIADGSSPTVAETGQFMANVEQFMVNTVADIAALKASLAQAGVDVAAVIDAIQAGE